MEASGSAPRAWRIASQDILICDGGVKYSGSSTCGDCAWRSRLVIEEPMRIRVFTTIRGRWGSWVWAGALAMTMLLALACAANGGGASTAPVPLEPIRISDDGRHFVIGSTGKPFTPWGFNYLGKFGELLEESWDS